jgi:hypothetical protein
MQRKGPKTEFAIQHATTTFQSRIIDPAHYQSRVIKSAKFNKKLGNGKYKIEKTDWKGFALYYLTLVERETCPTSCHHWDDCYGNNMWLADRFKAGKALEDKIKEEIRWLDLRHDNFVVRLHILGDFYSVEYVELWGKLLEQYDSLHIFGYTAVNSGPIYQAIRKHLLTKPEKVSLRFSVNDSLRDNFDSFDSLPHYFAVDEDYSGDSITCPEQTGKTDSCITCGLCWNSSRVIKFTTH